MQLGLADPDGALIDAVDRTRRFARGVADESGDALEEEYPDDDGGDDGGEYAGAGDFAFDM